MAKGVELASAYISLNVNTADVKKQVASAFRDVGAAGKTAGGRVGTEMTSAIRAKLADSSFIRNSLQNSTKGAGQKAATGFFQEFRSTSQRVGAVAGLVIGRTVGMGIRGGLAAVDFGANVFARIKTSAANMARTIGSSLAGAISGVAKGAALGAVGAVGYTLMAGFQRLEKIDQAKGKLRALGNSAQDVESIMQSATAAVEKTRFSLADSADLAAAAVAAGVKPGKELTKYLTTIADVAAVTGGNLDELGYVMNEVESANAAYNDSLQSLQTRGLPIYEWLAQQLGTTTASVKELASEGKISAQQFQQAIDTHIGGAALTMGGTVTSALENMRTAVARLGANFLSAILGNDNGDLANAKDAIDAFTRRLDEMGQWVKANRGQIRQFFMDAKDVVTGLVNTLRDVGNVLKDIPGGVTAVVTAFLAWKTIAGVASLLASLAAVNTMLGVSIPASAGIAAASLGPLAATIGSAVAGYLLLKDNETLGNKGTLGNGGGIIPPLGGFGGPLGVNENSPAQSGVRPGSPGMVGGSTPTVGGIPIPGLQMPNKPQETVKGAPGKGYPTAWGFPSVGQSAGIAPPASGKSNGAEGWRPTVRSVVQTYGPQYGIPAGAFGAWENALVRQIQTESGGNMNSVNPNDTDGRGGRQRVAGVLNFLESTFNAYNVSGGAYMDPVAQVIAAIPYVIERWGVDANGAPLQIGRGQGFADGGKVSGPGGPRSDSILARLSNGEFVVRAPMVNKHFGLLQAINSDRLPGFAEGGLAELDKLLQGDPNTMMHGQMIGAAPGPVDPQNPQQNSQSTELAQQTQPDQSDPLSEFIRTAGFTPVAAGNTGVAGTSFVSGLLNMGNEVVGGLIDTGASLAQTAVSAAITAGAAAGSMGAAAPAAPAAGAAGAAAASYGIQLGANVAKRLSSYGFQMAGIGADALIAQLFPFGAPRWLGYDYTQFLPQLGIQQGLLGGLEKMGTQAINSAFAPKAPNPQSPASPEDPMAETPGAPQTQPVAQQAPMPTPPPPEGAFQLPFLPQFAGGGMVSIYDQGGILPPGRIALNASRTPERVLTDKQWDSLANIKPAGQQPLVKIDAIYGMSPQDVADKIESKQKLAMMRYSGRP